MKKIRTVIKGSLVAIGIFMFTGVNAQIDVKSNFLAFVANRYTIAGEYSLSESMSAQLEVQYHIRKYALLNLALSESESSQELGLQGFTIIPSFRFYFSPDDPTEGFFVEPHFRFVNKRSSAINQVPVTEVVDGQEKTVNYDNVRFSINNFGAGLNIGKKYVHDSGFIFEMFAGGGRNFSSTVSTNETAVNNSEDYQVGFEAVEIVNSFYGRLGVSIGWRF